MLPKPGTGWWHQGPGPRLRLQIHGIALAIGPQTRHQMAVEDVPLFEIGVAVVLDLREEVLGPDEAGWVTWSTTRRLNSSVTNPQACVSRSRGCAPSYTGDMPTVPNLYDEVILDHIKNARNYRVMEDANRTAEGVNPLCGDTLSLYLRLAGDVIQDASFQCSCCGISMASASVMTEAVKGGTVTQAKELYRFFHRHLSKAGEAEDLDDLGEVAVLGVVRAFPARRNCALLVWETLIAALEDRGTAEL